MSLPAISNSSALPLADRFVMPPPPSERGLVLAMLQIMRPHPDLPPPESYPEEVVMAARRGLADISQMLEPSSGDLLKAWLWPIADGVEYVPNEDEFFRRVEVLWLAAQDIPYVAWTVQKQREGLRAWRRMPSVAQIVELVKPSVEPLLRRAAVYREIVATED